MAINLEIFNKNKSIKLSDAFIVSIKLADSEELIEIEQCVSFTVPELKYKNDIIKFGNTAIPYIYFDKSSSSDKVKIDVQETNMMHAYSLIKSCLMVNAGPDVFEGLYLGNGYSPYSSIPLLEIKVYDNNLKTVKMTHRFTGLKLVDYSLPQLDYTSSSPVILSLSFMFEGYEIESDLLEVAQQKTPQEESDKKGDDKKGDGKGTPEKQTKDREPQPPDLGMQAAGADKKGTGGQGAADAAAAAQSAARKNDERDVLAGLIGGAAADKTATSTPNKKNNTPKNKTNQTDPPKKEEKKPKGAKEPDKQKPMSGADGFREAAKANGFNVDGVSDDELMKEAAKSRRAGISFDQLMAEGNKANAENREYTYHGGATKKWRDMSYAEQMEDRRSARGAI